MATFFMGVLRGILILLYAEMAGDVQGKGESDGRTAAAEDICIIRLWQRLSIFADYERVITVTSYPASAIAFLKTSSAISRSALT